VRKHPLDVQVKTVLASAKVTTRARFCCAHTTVVPSGGDRSIMLATHLGSAAPHEDGRAYVCLRLFASALPPAAATPSRHADIGYPAIYINSSLTVRDGGMDDALLGVILERLDAVPLAEQAARLLLAACEDDASLQAQLSSSSAIVPAHRAQAARG
jgi:hypothetical protein